MKLASIRKEYSLQSLEINQVAKDPFLQFSQWLKEAVEAEVLEVNAMCLSTVSKDGFPNSRVVLLKELDEGFVFFTNYESAKGKDLESNPNGSLNNIAGVTNKNKNVFGMMPHPERAADSILANTDGKLLFESILENC